MKNTLALMLFVAAAIALSGCKGEKERQAEAIKEQEIADLKKSRSADTWKSPDLSGKKPAKEQKQ